MKWIYHEREAPTTNDILGKNHMLARLYFDSYSQETTKSRCILKVFLVFRHYMKRNPTKNFDCNKGILMYFVSF